MAFGRELVKALMNLSRGRDLERTRRIREPIERVAMEEGLPVPLLLGLSSVESDHKPEAVNPESGAAGLFQVMPFHHDDMVRRGVWESRDSWRDPYQNAKAGAIILRQSGYGREGLRRVLASYGGFKTKDPTEYQNKVLARSLAFTVADLAGMI